VGRLSGNAAVITSFDSRLPLLKTSTLVEVADDYCFSGGPSALPMCKYREGWSAR